VVITGHPVLNPEKEVAIKIINIESMKDQIRLLKQEITSL